mgnify:CR=1 FL=1
MNVYQLCSLEHAQTRRPPSYKVYVVFVDGHEVGLLLARSHNLAERNAQALYPGRNVSVEYTEV